VGNEMPVDLLLLFIVSQGSNPTPVRSLCLHFILQVIRETE